MDTENRIFEKDVDYEVYKFCKDNGIECSWDFEGGSGKKYTEIYIDNNLLFQLDYRMTLVQFFQIIKILSNNYEPSDEDLKSIPDSENIWFVAHEHFYFFNEFMCKYSELFKKGV